MDESWDAAVHVEHDDDGHRAPILSITRDAAILSAVFRSADEAKAEAGREAIEAIAQSDRI
jgi:hypothetical protein